MKDSPVKNMAYWKEKQASTPNKFFSMGGMGGMGGMMGGMMGGGGEDAAGGGTEFTTTDAPGMTENVDEYKQSKAIDPTTKKEIDNGGKKEKGGGKQKEVKYKYDLDIHGAKWNP